MMIYTVHTYYSKPSDIEHFEMIAQNHGPPIVHSKEGQLTKSDS